MKSKSQESEASIQNGIRPQTAFTDSVSLLFWLLASEFWILLFAQNLPHFLRQRLGRKWLLDKVRPFIQHALLCDCVIRVAGHEEHFHVRAYPLQAFRKVAPVHLGHDNVRDEKMNRSFFALADEK